MRPDHGFGLDDYQRLPSVLPDTAHENPDYAVASVWGRALVAAGEDLELLTEGDVLEDQRLSITKRSSEQVQDEFKHPGRLAGWEL